MSSLTLLLALLLGLQVALPWWVIALSLRHRRSLPLRAQRLGQAAVLTAPSCMALWAWSAQFHPAQAALGMGITLLGGELLAHFSLFSRRQPLLDAENTAIVQSHEAAHTSSGHGKSRLTYILAVYGALLLACLALAGGVFSERAHWVPLGIATLHFWTHLLFLFLCRRQEFAADRSAMDSRFQKKICQCFAQLCTREPQYSALECVFFCVHPTFNQRWQRLCAPSHNPHLESATGVSS